MIRYTLSSSFLGVVLSAKVAFSERSWPYVAATAVPWLLCAGQRCITRLAALGNHRRSLSGYYRFLSEGKWRMGLLFRSLFDLVVSTFGVTKLTLVLDDTLSPKWGRGIFGTGSFFDHTARPRPGYIWGHNWVALAVVVPIGTMWVALPFWMVLYRPEKTCRKEEFRTRHQLAAQALQAVRSWFSGPILLLADGAYANASLVGPARELTISVVSRIRSDARLREERPRPQPLSKRGRKPKHGPWLPRLVGVLAGQGRAFVTRTVSIYGKTVTLRLRELEAWWPALECQVLVVITRDPERKERVAYLVTTDLSMTAQEVVEAFARRWTIEQLFSVAKNQMGLDSAEVRRSGR